MDFFPVRNFSLIVFAPSLPVDLPHSSLGLSKTAGGNMKKSENVKKNLVWNLVWTTWTS